MGNKTEKRLITGDEIADERKRLIEAGFPDDATEFTKLDDEVERRDELLFNNFGRQFIQSDKGKWIGISLDGNVVLRNTASELIWAASRAFGDGNFAMRRLADFPGHELLA